MKKETEIMFNGYCSSVLIKPHILLNISKNKASQLINKNQIKPIVIINGIKILMDSWDQKNQKDNNRFRYSCVRNDVFINLFPFYLCCNIILLSKKYKAQSELEKIL